MVLGLALRVVSEPLHSHVFLFWLGLAGSASELVAIKTANLQGEPKKNVGDRGRDWREQFAVLGAGGNNPVTGGKMDWTNPPLRFHLPDGNITANLNGGPQGDES